MRSQSLKAGLSTIAVLAGSFGLAAPLPARAESTACTVVSAFPATLSVPGRYCLDQDVSLAITTMAAIHVTADDVDLDCNHHVVRTTAPAGNNATGLRGIGTRRNVRVRNCTFDGFETGVYLDGGTTGGFRLQGNNVMRAGSYGLFLSGNGNLVEDNRVAFQRGGSSIYPTALTMTGEPNRAVGNVIRNNEFAVMQPEMPANAGSAAIYVRYQQGTLIEGNTITTILSRTGGGSYGIISGFATELVVRGNVVLSPAAPGVAPFDGGNYSGIFLQGDDVEDATNQCVDNVVGHFNGNITGCVLVTNTGM